MNKNRTGFVVRVFVHATASNRYVSHDALGNDPHERFLITDPQKAVIRNKYAADELAKGFDALCEFRWGEDSATVTVLPFYSA